MSNNNMSKREYDIQPFKNKGYVVETFYLLDNQENHFIHIYYHIIIYLLTFQIYFILY